MRHRLYLLFIFIMLCTASILAQPTTQFKHQLNLIDSLKVFIAKELKLDIPDNFYTKWSKGDDSMYLYVYAASASKIEHGDTAHRSSWYYTNEDSARAKEKQLQAKGYHTLLYRTAGTSDAALSPKLLSYPDEAIAFIVIHEAVHNHIRNNEKYKGYPYAYEESLCDAVANLYIASLARQGKLLDNKAVQGHIKALEHCYKILNTASTRLQSGKRNGKILKATNRRIMRYTHNANQFLKDRMRYEVNNAYFLRTQDYSLYYFELKDKLYHLSVTDVVKGVLAEHGPKK